MNNRIITTDDQILIAELFNYPLNLNVKPTYQEIFDWLRINKIAFVSIKPIDDWEEYSYEILLADIMSTFFIETPGGFFYGSYEDCEVDALKELIKHFNNE